MSNFKLQVPKFENPFENFSGLSALEKHIASRLQVDGFCIFDFPLENFDEISQGLITKLTKHFKKESKDGLITAGQRIQDAIYIPEVLSIASNLKVIEILSNVYGKTAFPFQTLNFPSGTEQESHSDHVHFDSIPHRFMAGVWLALEDITEENGPLFYYPGSHKWPALYNLDVGYHSVDKIAPHYNKFSSAWDQYAKYYGIEKKYFLAKKGQCLIWTSNLVHGGSPVKNKKSTRWSQVTHYYFDECAYYTPVWSNPPFGNYSWRKIYDLRNKKYKPNKINGHIVDFKINNFPNRNFIFDPELYLDLNPDVKASGMNPYEHYLRYGINEGRQTNDSTPHDEIPFKQKLKKLINRIF